MTDDEFMKFVRERNEWRNHPERWTEAERLSELIMHGKKSDEEWLELQEEVRKFFASDASEEDKEYLRGYTECLGMICAGIEWRRQQKSLEEE